MVKPLLNICVISRDLRHHHGVVEYVRLLLPRLRGKAKASHFVAGPRTSRGGGPPFLRPLLDGVRLWSHVRRNRTRVVHLNPSLAWASLFRNAVLLLSARMAGSRVMVFFHGWKPVLARFLCAWPFRLFFRAVYGSAGSLAVLSSKARSSLVKAGFPPERVHVLSAMFEAYAFERVEKSEQPKPSRSGKTLLYMGPFERGRGLYQLLDAYSRLVDRHPSMRLVMAGQGDEEDGLRERVESLGLDRVGFPGAVLGDEKARLLLSCSVFVLPVRKGEECPFSLVEAMAAGQAVVATRVGGIPDVVEENRGGFLLDSPEPGRLMEILARFAEDPDLWGRMGEHNRRRAFDLYESAKVVDRIVDLYAQAAGSSAGMDSKREEGAS